MHFREGQLVRFTPASPYCPTSYNIAEVVETRLWGSYPVSVVPIDMVLPTSRWLTREGEIEPVADFIVDSAGIAHVNSFN